MKKPCTHPGQFNSRPRSGMSLVEIAISTFLVGVTLVASLETVGAVYRTQRLNATRLTGSSLAMELMTEILAMPYEDPELSSLTIGRESGETSSNRSEFDDVDDYENYNTLGAKSKSGAAVAGLSNWRRQVDVNWIDPLTGLIETSDTNLKRITVTVTSPDGKTTILTTYRSKWGMLEQPPVADMTVVAWIGATLQLGTGTPTAHIGTHLTNLAGDAP